MKKILIAALLLLSCSTASQAQWYVGGNIGISTKTQKVEHSSVTAETKSTNFSFTPRVGYIFNPRWSAGLGVGYLWGRAKADGETQSTSRGFSATPYVRYNFVFFGPFAVAAEAAAGYRNVYSEATSGSRNSRTEAIGIEVTPVLDLEISRNISLESRFNFFSIGYNYSKSTTKDNADKSVRKNSEFGAGFNGDELFTTGDITFGIIFKF